MFSVIVSKLYKYLMKKLLGKRLYRFRIIKLIHDYIVTLLPKENFEINGFKFNNNSGNLLLTEISNSEEISFCNKQIQKNMNVIDIGANIGYYTVHLSNLVGPNGTVFAFEPDPLNFSILEKNIKLNDCKNVVLINKAVSNSCASTTLFQNSENSGGHSLINSENIQKTITVDTITLDDYFKNITISIDLVKIDVEGAEDFVINGGLNFFKIFKPKYVITEFELNSKIQDKSFYPDVLSHLNYDLLGKIDYSKTNSNIIQVPIDELKKFQIHSTVVNLIWKYT